MKDAELPPPSSSLSFPLSSAHICALWCPDPLTNLRIVGRPSLPLSLRVCVSFPVRYQAEIKELGPCELPSDPTHTYQ